LCHSQALIYAVDEFHKNPNDDHLSLDWIYYKTTGSRKAEPRFQIVSRNTVAELFFTHVDPVAGEITRLHHEVPSDASALDFTPDFRACDAFGGCPFLSICNPTPTQRVQANMTQAGLSLTDKLKAMKAGRPPSPIHPPEAFAPVQAAPPTPPVPAVPAAPFSLPQPAAPAFVYAAPVPASAPSFDQAVPSTPLAPPFAQAAPPPQAAPAPPQEVAAPKKAPGRPRKKASAVAAPDTYGTLAADDAASEGRGGGPSLQAQADADQAAYHFPGFVLYIGCAPIGTAVTNALEYVNAAHDRLKDVYGATYSKDMAGALCTELEGLLALCEMSGNAPSGDVVLGNTRAERDTASVWLSRAQKVVRAFR